MKCSLSLDINKRDNKRLNNLVAKHGAINVTAAQTVYTKDLFDMTMSLPKSNVEVDSTIRKTTPWNRATSYLFSGSKFDASTYSTLTNGLSVTERHRMDRAGRTLPLEHAEEFFRRKKALISPTRSNENRVIFTGKTGDVKNTSTRTFVRVTSADKQRIYNRIVAQVEKSNKPTAESTNDMYNKALQGLIVSGLYRGYDLVFEGPMDGKTIETAINKFNKNLNPTGKNALYVSTIDNAHNAIHAGSFEAFLTDLNKTTIPFRKPILHNSIDLINAFIPERDRQMYDRYKKANNASKRYVVGRIASVFQKFMPNVDTQLLTTFEINTKYGPNFSNKKGFIIENEIILNIDTLDASTAFHEFGHYYMRWLQRYNKSAYDNILSFVAQNYQSRFQGYKNNYNSLDGLTFNTEEILEEIFVQELGLKAAQRLGDVLSSEDIQNNTIDQETISETIETFMDKFMGSLIRRSDIKRDDVAFTLETTIGGLFNIAYNFDTAKGNLFSNMDTFALQSMKGFFVERYTQDDVFEGLVSRGLIRRLDSRYIQLLDPYGNVVDEMGEYSLRKNHKFEYRQTDYKLLAKGFITKGTDKDKFLSKIGGYLRKYQNYASVRFADEGLVETVKQRIEDNSEGLKIHADENHYINPTGLLFNRTTGYLQETWTDNHLTETYVDISLYNKKMRQYKAARPDTEDEIIKNKGAIEAATNYMVNKGDAYEADRRAVEEVFKFKTDEGTYLHNLAEFFTRSLNYSNEIDYAKKKEETGYFYYVDHIIKQITNPDREEFRRYYKENFFDRIKDKGTRDYQLFEEGYRFISQHVDIDSSQQALIFLDKLKDTFKTHIFDSSAIPGPVTLMPEVKLSSESLGLAGTIDLLVIDGNGKVHIFDYKTKETGKEKFWAQPTPVRMKGEMKSHSNNARTKASIQTSIYRLILKEMGIETGPANVFYVESTIDAKYRSRAEETLADGESIHYTTKAIKKKPLGDVTGEIVEHFQKIKGNLPEVFSQSNDSKFIMEYLSEVSGGVNIDRMGDLDKTAHTLYNNALRRHSSSTDPMMAKAMAALGRKLPKKKLQIKLYGNQSFDIPSDLGEKASIEEIKKLLKERHDAKAAEASLEAQFYAPETQGFSSKDKAISGLLKGTDPSTHEYLKLASRLNLGVDFAGFPIIKNKITNEHRLIILNHDKEMHLPFGKDHHNIFGNYLTNNMARAKFPTLQMSNTTYNMRLIKAGLMIARMRQLDPDFKISMVVTNDDFREATSGTPNLVDINTIMYMTKAMIELSIEADPAAVPQKIKDMLKDEKLFEGKTYVPNPLDALGEFLSSAIQDVTTIRDIFGGDNKGVSRAKIVKEALDNLDTRQDYSELQEKIADFQTSLAYRLPNVDDRVNDPLWTVTDQVHMFLNGFNHTVSPHNTTAIQKFLLATSKVANTYSASFNRGIQGYTEAQRADFIKYKRVHNEWIDKLAESKGINIDKWGAAMYNFSMKEIYKNLWKTDNTDRKTAYVLKHPNDSTLSPVERDYILYLKKTFQEFADLSVYTKARIHNGWVPLVPRSSLGRSQDTHLVEHARGTLNIYDKNSSFRTKKDVEYDSAFSTENKLKGQMPGDLNTEDVFFTEARRGILGIDEQGEELPNATDRPLDKIEDNLENIMDVYVLAALDAHHYRAATSFGRALFYNIKRAENLTGLAYDQLVEVVTLIQRRIINHQESDGSNKAIKVLNRFTTNAAIAGTVNQFLLEAFTNPFVTGTNYFSDLLYGMMFKGTREFSYSAYAEAFTIVSNPNHKDHKIMQAINSLYGITSSDTRALVEMLNKLEKHSLWQSKQLMYGNKVMMELWQKVTMTAYMIHEGSFHAHSINENGELVYDETKDKRFYGGTTPEEIAEKKEKYKAYKSEMARHRNGLTGTTSDDFEDRKLNKAWVSYDSNHVKELIVELYSSMDETSKSLATYYSYMSFLFKMRSWIFGRLPRYFQKPMTAEENASAARLRRVEDPEASLGYRYEFKGEATEGILFTVEAIVRQLMEYKLQVFKKGSLEEHQKKNVAKLLADLGTFSVLAAAGSGLFALMYDDDDEKSELAQLVYQRWMMATGDVFLLKAIVEMSTGNGSMFINLSVASRLAQSITNTALISTQALIDPEVTYEDALSAVNRVFGSASGVYRTLELGYDTGVELAEE